MTISITPIPKLTEFATPDLTLTTSNDAGSAGVKTTIRSDASILTYDTTVPDSITFGQSAATGDTATAARRNHSHGMQLSCVTGTYTGDGTTSQVITAGITGAQIKFCMIGARVTSAGDMTNKGFVYTSDGIVDDIATGCALNLTSATGSSGVPEWSTNSIIALGTNSFTVDDAGGNAHPNKDGETYNYIVWA
jgi:hypothetical protein